MPKNCHGGSTPMGGSGLSEEAKKNIKNYWASVAEEKIKKLNEELYVNANRKKRTHKKGSAN